MKRTTFAAIIVGALLAGGLFFTFLRSSGQEEAGKGQGRDRTPEVRAIPASRSTISRTLDLTGSAEPIRVAQLASPAEGPVQHLRVREGDRLKAGDIALTIGRKKGIDALIASLREELKKEEGDLERIRQLVISEALPGELRDHAETRVEKIRAELVRAEETALDYTVAAPWSGIVSRLHVHDGEFVSPRTPLIELYDPANVIIRAAVPEKHAAEIRNGMRLTVHLDAYPHKTFSARISRVYPYLDQRMRTRTIEIETNEQVELLPGMFARLTLRLETAENAIVVPEAAVVMGMGGKRAVFVVVDGKAVSRPVETGIEEGNLVQLVSGVDAGDKVIVAGNERLKDGVMVRLAGDGAPGAKQPGPENSPASGPGGAKGGLR